MSVVAKAQLRCIVGLELLTKPRQKLTPQVTALKKHTHTHTE